MQYSKLLQLTATAAWQEWHTASSIACTATARLYHGYTNAFFSEAAMTRYRLLGEIIGHCLIIGWLLIDRYVQASLAPSEDVGTASRHAGAPADGIAHPTRTQAVHEDAGATRRNGGSVARTRGHIRGQQVAGVVISLATPRDAIHKHARTALSPHHA